jgi:hypothetical protein
MGGALKVNPHTGELYRGSLFGTWIFPAPYDEVPDPDTVENNFGFKINPDSVKLSPGASQPLIAEFSLSCLADLGLFWSSSDTTVARISGSGEVTAVAEGNCTITAVSEFENLSADCEITVESNATETRSYHHTSFKAYTDLSNQLHVTFPNEVRVSEIKLSNLLGEVVFVQTYNKDLSVRQKVMDVSALSNGFYILTVTTTTGYCSQQKIISR